MWKANSIDVFYRQAVDANAKELLVLSREELVAMPAEGEFTVVINGKEITGEVWHHKLGDNSHRIVFQILRKSWLSVSPYLSGVKLTANDKISLLCFQEVSEYEL